MYLFHLLLLVIEWGVLSSILGYSTSSHKGKLFHQAFHSLAQHLRRIKSVRLLPNYFSANIPEMSLAVWTESSVQKVSKYVFGLNTEIYLVNLCIQPGCRKIRTRKNSVFGHFLRSGKYQNSEAYSEPCQTINIEFHKSFILDERHSSEYACRIRKKIDYEYISRIISYKISISLSGAPTKLSWKLHWSASAIQQSSHSEVFCKKRVLKNFKN